MPELSRAEQRAGNLQTTEETATWPSKKTIHKMHIFSKDHSGTQTLYLLQQEADITTEFG